MIRKYFRKYFRTFVLPEIEYRYTYACNTRTKVQRYVYCTAPFKPWISVNWRSLKGWTLRVHFTLNSVASTLIQGLKGAGLPIKANLIGAFCNFRVLSSVLPYVCSCVHVVYSLIWTRFLQWRNDVHSCRVPTMTSSVQDAADIITIKKQVPTTWRNIR